MNIIHTIFQTAVFLLILGIATATLSHNSDNGVRRYLFAATAYICVAMAGLFFSASFLVLLWNTMP